MFIHLGQLRKSLFGIPLAETGFARRGFQAMHPAIQEHLERIGRTFLEGYHAALLTDDLATLGRELNRIEPERQGFAFEGAAMALMLLDLLTPWKVSRLQAFLDGPGADHIYMVHVGAGWAMVRIPWGLRCLGRMDSLLRWLALDGYGFHQGYFHWQDYVDGGRTPNVPEGYTRRAFDQGLGRSLWFVGGADIERIVETIAGFPSLRRADLWSGVGLAAAYAGGVRRSELEDLSERAGPFFPELAQGAAFAAKARQRAGNPAPHTELACQVLCNLSAADAAALTDAALHELPTDTIKLPSFEIWRRRIQARFQEDRP